MSPRWDPRLDGLIRVEAGWLAFGRRSFNVWWVVTSPPVTTGILVDAAETVAAWDSLIFAAFRSEDHQLYSVRAADRSDSPIASYERVGIGQHGVVRNITNPMMPSPQAVVAQWHRGFNSGRPHRSYLSGLTTLLWGFPFPLASTDLTTLEPIAAEALELGVVQLLNAFNAHPQLTMVAPSILSAETTVEPITGLHINRHYTGTRVRRGPGRQRVP